MKLHRIRLRNFRGVRDREVEFAESGVTIVEGPNEVGKSSIAEALELAIEYPDSSRHRKIQSAKPEDRDEGPEVEIEMSTGPYVLTYQKRWIRRPTTTLNVTAPENENHTGRAAHDRLEAILRETLDDDLRLALQIDQGTELKLPSFSIPSMRRALENATDGDASDAEDEDLMERIRAEFERYWTATGRVTGKRIAAAKEVEEARERVQGLKEQMDRIEGDAAEMVRLAEEASGIAQTLQELAESERKLTDEWAAIDRLQTDLERIDAVHVAASSKRQQALQEHQRREELKGDLEAGAKALTELDGEAELAAPALFAATGQSEEAAASRNAAADALRSARERQDRTFGDRNFRQDEIDEKLISERYERYMEAEKLLRDSVEFLRTAAVDEEKLAEIERAYGEDVKAQAAVESAAATVEATALSDIALQINGEEVELETDQKREMQVSEQLEVVVPGVARLRVSAAPEARVLAERRRSVHDAYLQLCNSVGVGDLEEARRAEQARRDAIRNQDEARKAIAREVRDWTPEILKSRIESLSENVRTYLKERPEDPPMPVDLDEARRIAGEAAGLVADCERELQVRETVWKEREKYLNKVRLQQAELAARVDVARGRQKEASERLAAARESVSDEELSDALDMAKQVFEVSIQSLEEAKGRLKAADPDSLRARLDNVSDAKGRFETQLRTNEGRQHEIRASLELRGEMGLHGSYDEAVSRFEQARREHEGEESRARAAKLLKETFDKHRRLANQRNIKPLKERIDWLGGLVFGPTFEVKLDDEELRVVGRTLDGVTLEVDQLSTGAREQLGVLSRLACAAIVSPEDGGAPVMIDDALGWSDPQRLQSMGAAIAVAGKQCQIVILTCFPGRYAHVGNAEVVRL